MGGFPPPSQGCAFVTLLTFCSIQHFFNPDSPKAASHERVLRVTYTRCVFSLCQIKAKSRLSEEGLYLEGLLQQGEPVVIRFAHISIVRQKGFSLQRGVNKTRKSWMWGSGMKRCHDGVIYPEARLFSGNCVLAQPEGWIKDHRVK